MKAEKPTYEKPELAPLNDAAKWQLILQEQLPPEVKKVSSLEYWD